MPGAARISPSAHVDPGAMLAQGVSVGAGAYIGSGALIWVNATIGRGAICEAGSEIGTGAVVGSQAQIGKGARVADMAVVRAHAALDDGVVFRVGDLSGAFDKGRSFGWSLASGRHIPVLTVGCESWPLEVWTPEFLARMGEVHAAKPETQNQIARLIARCNRWHAAEEARGVRLRRRHAHG